MIADDSNTRLLRSALTQVVGGVWRVEVVPEGAVAADSPPSAGAATQPAGGKPELDPRDDTDAGADAAGEPRPVVDPEAEALKLLQDQLGARPVADA